MSSRTTRCSWSRSCCSATPKRGASSSAPGGARKLRVARPGRGKSGGARVIYFYVTSRGEVFFLDVYAKNVRETLTASEKRDLARLIRALEGKPSG